MKNYETKHTKKSRIFLLQIVTKKIKTEKNHKKTKIMTKMEKINQMLDNIINQCQQKVEEMNQSIEANTEWKMKQTAREIRNIWFTRKEQTKFIKYELNKESI